MRRHARVWLMGSVGLLVAISAGLPTARGQEGARLGGAEAGAGAAAGQSTELMITHALDMALEGSELQLIIRQAGGPVMGGRADAGVTRTGGAGISGPGATDTGRGGLLQLQQHTRRSFQESYELMKASNRLLRGGGEERADRASASRLYAAANLYVNTLYTLGRQTFGWQAGWEPMDRAGEGGERPGRTGQGAEGNAGRAGTAGGPKLSTGDIATITLINHAVKESLAAFELGQSLRNQASGDVASQRLREHVRAMAAESRQSIERILASMNESAGATGAASTGGAAAQEGWSGTQAHALAQQAREVIRVLDELGGHGGAPGAIRGNQ